MIENKFSKLAVAYAQMVVFDAELEMPFNDWTSTHVDQGFSCRESSVSFALSDRIVEINVSINDTSNIERDPYLGISVPIIITGTSGLCIGTLVQQYTIPIEPGNYVIRFLASRTDFTDIDDINLIISPGKADPCIIINDGSISHTSEFLMSADPA